jgi:hypothetical protein
VLALALTAALLPSAADARGKKKQPVHQRLAKFHVIVSATQKSVWTIAGHSQNEDCYHRVSGSGSGTEIVKVTAARNKLLVVPFGRSATFRYGSFDPADFKHALKGLDAYHSITRRGTISELVEPGPCGADSDPSHRYGTHATDSSKCGTVTSAGWVRLGLNGEGKPGFGYEEDLAALRKLDGCPVNVGDGAVSGDLTRIDSPTKLDVEDLVDGHKARPSIRAHEEYTHTPVTTGDYTAKTTVDWRISLRRVK